MSSILTALMGLPVLMYAHKRHKSLWSCLLQERAALQEQLGREDAAWEPPEVPTLDPQLAWMQVSKSCGA